MLNTNRTNDNLLKMIMKLSKDIFRYKIYLSNKCKRTGLYENFGQIEVRKLEDKYNSFLHIPEFKAMIVSFDEWCMSYTRK